MIELSTDAYLWTKALHIISVISWMAGLLYLPRLYVYHCQADTGSKQSETFKVMERRLLRFIMNPAMIASLITGVILLLNMGDAAWEEGWVHVKLLAALGLLALHMMMGGWRKAFAEDRNQKPEKFFRIANEGPTVLMIVIVILAVVRPF